LARDSRIASLYAEKELKIMIEGLDRSNEVIEKHLKEYEKAKDNLSVGEKLELISELVNYQDHQEGERVKRQGLKIDQGSSKRMKTSGDVSKEELKGMMQLVPLEEVYVKALHVKHPIIDWEIHSEGMILNEELIEASSPDQNVIDEDYHEFIQIWLAHPIHQIHEYQRSDGANLYGARATSAAPQTKLIWNSTCRADYQDFISPGNPNDFVTNDHRMMIRQPFHANEDVKTTKFYGIRFYVLAIVTSFALTLGPSGVLLVRESHNLRDSNSLKGFDLSAKGMVSPYDMVEEILLSYGAYQYEYK
nr:hypothetical protein [Tanacetum cinerariifolium]